MNSTTHSPREREKKSQQLINSISAFLIVFAIYLFATYKG